MGHGHGKREIVGHEKEGVGIEKGEATCPREELPTRVGLGMGTW